MEIAKGATSVLDEIFIQDSSSTTGAGKTGLTSASVTCYRGRADDGNAGGTVISLTSTGTLGTWASGWFKEKDATNLPGVYEVGYTNASLASGSRFVFFLFTGTGIVPRPVKIELTGWDNQDAVHGGLSALPNTACTTNASLLTSGSGTDQILTSSGKVTVPDTQKVDLNTIKTQAVACAGSVTVPAATLASTTNITAATGLDVTKWAGTTVGTPDTAGYPKVTVKTGTGAGELNINSGVVNASVNEIENDSSNVAHLNGLLDGSGTYIPQVDVRKHRGTTIPATATAGIADVNAKAINNVSTSSVTTVGANIGTTQPIAFSGTGASALVDTNLVKVGPTGAGTAQTAGDLIKELFLRCQTKTWIVSPGGNNSNPGYRESPLLTPQQANANASSGDGVTFAGGTTTTTKWTPSKRLNVNFDRGSKLVSTTADTVLELTANADGSTVSNFTIEATGGSDNDSFATILVSGASNITLSHGHVSNTHGTMGINATNAVELKLARVVASGYRYGLANYGSRVRNADGEYTGGSAGGYADSSDTGENGYEDAYLDSDNDQFIAITSAASITGLTYNNLSAYFYECHTTLDAKVHLNFRNPTFIATANSTSFANPVAALLGEPGSLATSASINVIGGRSLITNKNPIGTTYHLAPTNLGECVAIGHDHDPTKNTTTAIAGFGTPQLIDVDIATAKASAATAVTQATTAATQSTTAATEAAGANTKAGQVKAKTDALPPSPAATSDIPSAAANASAVRTNLTTELARLDVATSTRATPDDVSGGGADIRGPGADLCTITLAISGAPVADADVWITASASAAPVIAGTLQTNSDGEATFLLDDGVTYYLWAQKDGVNSVVAQSFVAEAD